MDKITEEDGNPTTVGDPPMDDSNFEEVKLIDNQEETKETVSPSARPEIATRIDVIETRIKNGKNLRFY